MYPGLTMISSSDTSSDEEMVCQYDAVDALQIKPAPTLFLEEIMLKNTYTYDDEPVAAFREISDFLVLKECCDVVWGEISALLGDFHGYHNNLCLYRGNDILKLISKIICKNNCYFFPENCFLEHEEVDLKHFFKRSLHDQYNPDFESLFKKDPEKVVKLKRAESGMPIMWKLAEDIGINTILEYDDNGLLSIDFDVLNSSFWNNERPIFFIQEKKVLDVIFALLKVSLPLKENAIKYASTKYSQQTSKLNDPLLKIMCHGPDFDDYVSLTVCDVKKDELRAKQTVFTSVKHTQCSSFKRSDHWTYTNGENNFCEDIDENFIICGPVAMSEYEPLIYPCNLRHCWVRCKCIFCQNNKILQCKEHKMHLKFNIKNCVIQKHSQCQDHWIDHPDNFDSDQDIEVQKKLLFHNSSILAHGQNYHLKTVKYAGLKISCKNCKSDSKNHFVHHLTPHVQCKHCLHELKTMKEETYWQRVCSICGKEFKSISAKKEHRARHGISPLECCLCGKVFSNKFTLKRHINEEHQFKEDSFSEDKKYTFTC